MKKIALLLIASTVIAINAIAQDSTKINTSFTIASKNFWRGAVYGDNIPSLSGTLSIQRGNFELGTYGTSPINGSSKGYGIWMEVFASYTIGKFNVTVDDYFFFNELDEDNDYFNWNRNTTQHLVEARLKYFTNKFSLTGSYVVYAAEWSINSLYFETEYYIIPQLSVLAGYVAGESYLNFYDDSGVTHVGLAGNRVIKVTNDFSIPVRAALYGSPNYKDIAELPGLRKNPINFVVTLSF